MGYFSHILGIRAISPIHWIQFLICTYMIECPKDKIIIHRASGEEYGVLSGLQRSQKSFWKLPKIAYFQNCFCIRAISPIYWIEFLIVTYIVECPNAKSVILEVPGVVYGLISGLRRPQKSKKSPKMTYFSNIFLLLQSYYQNIESN